jgi:hypothetical protein
LRKQLLDDLKEERRLWKKLRIALFGDLSLEDAVDLLQDGLLLDLDLLGCASRVVTDPRFSYGKSGKSSSRSFISHHVDQGDWGEVCFLILSPTKDSNML